jgi:hypothetical protein
MVAPTGKNV